VVPSAVAAPKNVLILSEGPLLPYGAVLRENTIAGLVKGNIEPLNIYEEFIDRVRFDSNEYDRQLVALYKSKYIDAAPDLFITMTEPALDFALRHRDELFPHSALLFGAVDERVTATRSLGTNVTGVFSHYDARATLELALTLHPRTRRVLVIAGASRLDRGYLDLAKMELRGVESRVDITYITGRSLNEVLAAAAALRDDALVLFLSLQADGDGVARGGPEVLVAIRRVTTVPIYGMSRSFLGRGIVGGRLFDMQSHGTDLARRARQLLSGVHAADLAPISSPNTFAFDWRELKRFGVDEALLPPGATVLNRQLSLWNLYKRTILVVSAVLAGQSLLISGLWVQGRRRRRAELALQTLSGRLLSAQEEERRRIARELHDSVNQRMALLAIEIEQVAVQSGRFPAMVRALRHLGERTAEISTEIHNICHRLHSVKLETLGLVAAVRGHCHEVQTQGVHVHFSEGGVAWSVSHDVEVCLFRIVQEGVSNVVKHSGAHEAYVMLSGTRDELVLSVADSGRGFDEAGITSQDGLGLASMRERLRLIGGELTIRSRAGQGTRIDARVPLANPAGRPVASNSERVA
jgi:signal transduction histidine kinase/ABC-type uncharacterized transport system substrate-binding protein